MGLRLAFLVLLSFVVRGAHANWQAQEVARIQQHLLGAEALCRSRNFSQLTPTQRQARATHLKRLAAYRERGVFPKNEAVATGRVPVFRDRYGTLCAMGYLIEKSGRHDLVDKVARTRNLATIHQLADDPALVRWLSDNGISLEEAARIQPTYSYFASKEDKTTRKLAYLGSATSLAAPSSRTAGYFSLGLGTVSILRSLDTLNRKKDNAYDDYEHVRSYATKTALYGLVSVYLGQRAIERNNKRSAIVTLTPTPNGGATLLWLKPL
ncbi:MAG: hypothetical protein QM758_22200 [Armatimonas sp.]